jgi:hypothetical protein
MILMFTTRVHAPWPRIEFRTFIPKMTGFQDHLTPHTNPPTDGQYRCCYMVLTRQAVV